MLKALRKNKWVIKAFLSAKWALKKRLFSGYLKRKKRYYPHRETPADVKRLIYCALCPNMCRFDCPVLQASKREKHAVAQKARLSYYLVMDRLPREERFSVPVFEGCARCDNCKVWCPFGFSFGELLEGVAVDLFEGGGLPRSAVEHAARVAENRGLYPADEYAAAKVALEPLATAGAGEPARPLDAYYFPGCVTLAHRPETLKAVVKLAGAAGVNLGVDLAGRSCCGAPSIAAGDLKTAETLAAANRDSVDASGAGVVVCECPECAHVLKEVYPRLLGVDLGVEVLHASQWVAHLLESGQLSLEPSPLDSGPVVYHDPCVLARKLGVAEAPKKLLAAATGAPPLEPPYAGEGTHCCGFGGLVNVVNPELAGEVCRRRLAELDRTGGKALVTSCPTCALAFLKHDVELHFEVMDLLEVVASKLAKKTG
ncbi:MAG: (Fe-S)-binding protein [Promethearchaeota archaeon]